MWYPLTKIVESTKIAQGFFAMAASKKCFKLLALPLLAMFQYLQQWSGKILVCVRKCISFHLFISSGEYFRLCIAHNKDLQISYFL